jgi:hypothetical protein
MKSQVIKKLRELSQVTGKQKTWISTCSDDQLYELFLRLRNGESARSIAQYVQKVWKLFARGNIHSLSQGILKFQKRINDLLQASLIPANNEPVEEKISKQEDHDDLLSLDRVVRLQRERVERMMKEEKELGVKHSNLSRDIQSLAALTKVLVKEKEFAIRHAIDPVRERENEIRGRRIDKNFNAWMDNTTQEGRERMVDIMDRFIQKIAEHSIPVLVTTDENGNIKYITEKQNNSKEENTDDA